MGRCVRNLETGFVRHFSLLEDPPFDPQTEELIEAESLESVMPSAQAAKATVPAAVTATQAKRALIQAGLYEAADQWISVAEMEPNGYTYRVVWNAMHWYRASEELNEIATSMGLTASQVDDLFRLAETFQ